MISSIANDIEGNMHSVDWPAKSNRFLGKFASLWLYLAAYYQISYVMDPSNLSFPVYDEAL